MSKFKTGDEVIIKNSDHVARLYHGKVAVVQKIWVNEREEEIVNVRIIGEGKGPQLDETWGWTTEAFRRATKLDKVLK